MEFRHTPPNMIQMYGIPRHLIKKSDYMRFMYLESKSYDCHTHLTLHYSTLSSHFVGP